MNSVKKSIILSALLILHAFAVYGQHTLGIEIGPFENSKGQVKLALFDEKEQVLKEISGTIMENQCHIEIDSLQPGAYAFKYFHDENKNNKLDTKLFFIPKEAYGFSNNAKGKFGPPPFNAMIFELKTDSTMVCKPIF